MQACSGAEGALTAPAPLATQAAGLGVMEEVPGKKAHCALCGLPDTDEGRDQSEELRKSRQSPPERNAALSMQSRASPKQQNQVFRRRKVYESQ